MAQRAEAVQVTEVGSAGVTRPVMRRCVTEEPQLREIKPGAASKCHYLEQLTLEGQQLGEESEPTRRLPQDPGASARPSD
jgi:hypothetical protein